MGDLFFILSKVVWALLRPDTMLLILIFIGITARRWGKLRRFGNVVIDFAVSAFLLIGLLPLQSLVLWPLETRFDQAPSVQDVAGIVLLGGSEDLGATVRSGQAQVNQAGDRYLTTLTLARAHPEALVVFAGGGAQLRPGGGEARVAEALLTAGGLDPERLRLENRSRNTHENAFYARQLAPDQGDGTWLLVTSAAHMPRALGTFCAAGWHGIVPYPTDYRAKPIRLGWNPSGNLSELNAATREWVGLVAYWMTGRSTSLFPRQCPKLVQSANQSGAALAPQTTTPTRSPIAGE